MRGREKRRKKEPKRKERERERQTDRQRERERERGARGGREIPSLVHEDEGVLVEERHPPSARAQGQMHGAPSCRLEGTKVETRRIAANRDGSANSA